MENYYYAQVMGGVVIAVSRLSGPVSAANMIRLTDEQFETVQPGDLYSNGNFTKPN